MIKPDPRNQGSHRFVRLYFPKPSPQLMIAVEYEDADWISGYEVDSEGERISRRGKFDQRYHKVHKTAIIRQIEYRQDLTYGTLERIKS